MTSPIRPLDLARLKAEFRSAQPFPFIRIDDFLDDAFAREVAGSYPTFENAERMGFTFNLVNEQRKVQITDRTKFPAAVSRLSDALSSQEFLSELSEVTGIPKLLADAQLRGGGMHVTGPGGRLDVHVDFNYFKEENLHRRLNILIYLNQEWAPGWGGQLELWDKGLRNLAHSFEPQFNRCVIFETSEISFHGVRPLTCPPETARRSFAAYYYTHEAPAHFTGAAHSTIFKPRPDETWRDLVLVPAEKIKHRIESRLRSVETRLRGLFPRRPS